MPSGRKAPPAVLQSEASRRADCLIRCGFDAARTRDRSLVVPVLRSSLPAVLLAAFCLVVSARAEPRVAAQFPLSAATQVCADTPLRITFDSAPRLGTAGRIRVFAENDTLVDTIDLAASAQTRAIGGVTYNFFPVIIAGNTAHVQLYASLPTTRRIMCRLTRAS